MTTEALVAELRLYHHYEAAARLAETTQHLDDLLTYIDAVNLGPKKR